VERFSNSLGELSNMIQSLGRHPLSSKRSKNGRPI
jgi:hypothetical protein